MFWQIQGNLNFWFYSFIWMQGSSVSRNVLELCCQFTVASALISEMIKPVPENSSSQVTEAPMSTAASTSSFTMLQPIWFFSIIHSSNWNILLAISHGSHLFGCVQQVLSSGCDVEGSVVGGTGLQWETQRAHQLNSQITDGHFIIHHCDGLLSQNRVRKGGYHLGNTKTNHHIVQINACVMLSIYLWNVLILNNFYKHLKPVSCPCFHYIISPILIKGVEDTNWRFAMALLWQTGSMTGVQRALRINMSSSSTIFCYRGHKLLSDTMRIPEMRGEKKGKKIKWQEIKGVAEA